MSLFTLSGTHGWHASSSLMAVARGHCRDGRRVLWVGLPTQRNTVLQNMVAEGGIIGFEFVSEQQLCYRLLSRARLLRPLRVGTERLALVGAALAEVQQSVPLPGEARLFAAGIAELKRHGLTPVDSSKLAFDHESERLAEVHERYERLKGDAWDYDDYRSQALLLARNEQADPGADAILVAGYRELLPMTAELYAELASKVDVHVSLPEIPDQLEHGELQQIEPRKQTVRTERYRAPNEVEEARWVLRSVKQELAAGAGLEELALVVPAGELRAYQVLAEEYDVPLMPEVPVTMAESLAGRTLLELMGITDFTSPSALLALPGLERLASEALERRISGEGALLKLAASLDRQAAEVAAEAAALDTSADSVLQTEGQPGEQAEPAPQLEDKLRFWLLRLATASPGLAWAETLLDLVIAEILPGRSAPDFEASAFRAQALQRAREAAQLGAGDSFRAWWAALLEETRLPLREPAGVALITPGLASGRHYRKAWLAAATSGAYLADGFEDYFVPEELRERHAATGLPRRFRGGESLVLDELLELADELIISYAQSSQGGQNTPQLELISAGQAAELPVQPAGNRFELEPGTVPRLDHQLEATLVSLPAPEVRWLMRYGECPHRSWSEELLEQTGDLPLPDLTDWQRLRRELTRSGRLDQDGLHALAERHTWAADWLQEHADLLVELHYGQRLPQGGGLQARIDASGRLDGVVSIFRFCGPAEGRDAEHATRLLSARAPERWLASYLLEHARQRLDRVRLYAWPLLSAPVEAGTPGGQTLEERWLRKDLGQLDDHLEKLLAGNVEPVPGYRQCRFCRVADMCRKGVR